MLPILVSIPHCSFFIPRNIRSSVVLDDWNIRSYCDMYTDLLFNLPETFQVQATVSRLVVDPNRSVDDIHKDPENILTDSIPLHSLYNLPIYRDKLSKEEIKKRIEKYHALYHWQLEMYLPLVKFLIDGHSMYSVAPPKFPDAGTARSDICLGTLGGRTCPPEHIEFFKQSFENLGYSVRIDEPFAGKYIMEKYCVSERIPGIQFEVNQALYMDEKTQKADYDKITRLNEEIGEMIFHFCEKFFPEYIF